MVRLLKKLNYRFYICISITLAIISLSFLVFPNSFYRLIDSIKDFGLSIAYYFCEFFGFPYDFTPSVTLIPSIPSGGSAVSPDIIIPKTSELFDIKMSMYWSRLWNVETLLMYLSIIINFIGNLCRYLLIFAPLVLVAIFGYRRYFTENDNEQNSDSRQLKAFKTLQNRIFKPVINWIKSLIEYVKVHRRFFYILWILLFAYYFNFYTIIIEFLAFYFYFVISFDMGNIYVQVYKLFLDLLPMFKFVPMIIWIAIGIKLFNNFRKNVGYSYLNHFEMKNRGFINTLGQVSMVCGSMGKGKTTALTDMALSQEAMFRDKAFELLLLNDMMFPNFPFINLENEVRILMDKHIIYNLATCKKYIRKKAKLFRYKPIKKRCYDYDFEKYGLVHNNGLEEIFIFKMLEDYVQLYFIYVIECSLMVANYSIREDNVLDDIGNFPLWNIDFFKRDSRLMNAYSRHAHIMDFDMFRLGKKIIKRNKKRNAFEFGVVVISEGGKERGNQLDNKGIKKDDEKSNVLNDLFNAWLKLVRHSATVCNFPFIKVLIDEQRPESMGADVRELCMIAHIAEKDEPRSTLMLFRLETMIYDFMFSKFESIYYKYRYYRKDNTLFSYLLKNIMAIYCRYYWKLKNTFSYMVQHIETEKGTLDGQTESTKYYLSFKKIYSKRFATDCFSDYFAQKSIKSDVGIEDLEEFETERATLSDMRKYNSRFINELIEIQENEVEV